jgi:hypothetical protein
MKKYSSLYVFIIWLAPLLSKAEPSDSTEKRYRLAVEVLGSSRFYDISTTDRVYKRNNPGLSYGGMLQLKFKRNFYIALGTFYSQSSFTWDTTGAFPPGATFLAPLAIEKKFAYLDKVFVIGKDIPFCEGKWSAGISVGLTKGTLIKGKSYIRGGYTVSIPWVSGNDPQFNSSVNSILFRGKLAYNISPWVSVQANIYYRKYQAIDTYLEFIKSGADPRPPTFYHNLWNYGIGIQYNFCKRKG